MGVRFACHGCGKRLNIKADLAGKRGKCPKCSTRFRIPLRDAETSTPVEDTIADSGVELAASPSTKVEPTPASAGITPAESFPTDLTTQNATTTAQIVSADQTQPTASTLDVLTVDPNATWYVRPPGGGQYGPASGEVLRDWIGQGRVAATALVWRDGWPQWRQADEAIPGLASQMPSTTESSHVETLASESPATNATASSQSIETPVVPLKGAAEVGAKADQRNKKRVAVIVGMSVACITLVLALIYAVMRG